MWDDVYIDDFLPCQDYGNDEYQIVAAHSATDKNEMWVTLLEKAFARYVNVCGMFVVVAWVIEILVQLIKINNSIRLWVA